MEHLTEIRTFMIKKQLKHTKPVPQQKYPTYFDIKTQLLLGMDRNLTFFSILSLFFSFHIAFLSLLTYQEFIY